MNEASRGLLQSEIASAAYSIGFGAKIHYATTEMAVKVPGWIDFFSLAIGIYGLAIPALSVPFLAASLVVAGVVSLYFVHYQDRRSAYERAAKDLLKKYYDLQDLCVRAASAPEQDLEGIRSKMADIRRDAKEVAIDRQVFLAGWIAHLKFWGQAESAWIEKYRRPQIRFLRDKVPISFSFTVLVIVLSLLVILAWKGLCLAGRIST